MGVDFVSVDFVNVDFVSGGSGFVFYSNSNLPSSSIYGTVFIINHNLESLNEVGRGRTPSLLSTMSIKTKMVCGQVIRCEEGSSLCFSAGTLTERENTSTGEERKKHEHRRGKRKTRTQGREEDRENCLKKYSVTDLLRYSILVGTEHLTCWVRLG